MFDYAFTTKFAVFMVFAIGICYFILPIVMATTFKCTNRKWVILSMFVPIIGWVLSLYLIYKNKKQSKLYENYGKNIVWFNILLYILSIFTLFMPMAKVRVLDSLKIPGVTNFNLSFFLKNKNELIGEVVKQDEYKILIAMIWIMIISLIIGLILNLIFRDARKTFLLGANMIIQSINTCLIYTLTHIFDNYVTLPGIAFTFELFIITVFVISIFVTVYKTSYVDINK